MQQNSPPSIPSITTDSAIGEFDRYASVTIQGGAVYGLSLLGQLQGILDEGCQVVALSGTSAGAIVATLHWAGLKTDDVRDFFAVLSGPPNRVTELLGEFDGGSKRFDPEMLGRMIDFVAALRAYRSDLIDGPIWSRVVAGVVLPLWPLLRPAATLRTIRDLRAAYGAVSRGGLFSGELFERTIDRLLRESPRIARHIESGRLPAHGLLTFGQFRQLLDSGDEYFPLLFLTATNLGTRELELFDSSDPRFSNVPVARAVRASAGFPWFFRPVEIALPDPEDPDERAVHCFVDGGVICNFPAYIFARRVLRERFERSLEGIYRPYAMRPWLNVGLRLTDTTRSETDPGRFRTFAGVTAGMKKLLSEGTRTYLETLLAESTVERLFSIGQPFAETGWDDNLLAFDKLSPALVRDMYDRGRAFARSKFSQLQFRGPPPDEIEPRMAELIETALRVFGLLEGNAGLMLRASLFVPREFELVLEYRANMNDLRDTDRDLRFDFEQGLVGLCFNRRRPLVCNLRQFKAALDDGEMNPLHSLGLDAGIQSRVREDRTWLMSVPVFDPTTADPDPFGDEPEISDEGRHFAELDTPLDGALFGVLSLDGGFEYGTIDMPEEVERQVIDLRVLALRDIMVAAAWDIGKIFDAYFAAVPPAFDTEEPTHGE